MRLLRYGPPGREKPGMADADGKIRDPLQGHHPDRRQHAGARNMAASRA